jgi:hypothetical protein
LYLQRNAIAHTLTVRGAARLADHALQNIFISVKLLLGTLNPDCNKRIRFFAQFCRGFGKCIFSFKKMHVLWTAFPEGNVVRQRSDGGG